MSDSRPTYGKEDDEDNSHDSDSDGRKTRISNYLLDVVDGTSDDSPSDSDDYADSTEDNNDDDDVDNDIWVDEKNRRISKEMFATIHKRKHDETRGVFDPVFDNRSLSTIDEGSDRSSVLSRSSDDEDTDDDEPSALITMHHSIDAVAHVFLPYVIPDVTQSAITAVAPVAKTTRAAVANTTYPKDSCNSCGCFSAVLSFLQRWRTNQTRRDTYCLEQANDIKEKGGRFQRAMRAIGLLNNYKSAHLEK